MQAGHRTVSGFEDLAEQALLMQKAKTANKKTMVRIREVLGWHIPDGLGRIALQEVVASAKPIMKSTAVKTYGKTLVDQCPWCLLADNPHYKSSSPMQLYFPKLLEALRDEMQPAQSEAK